MPNPATLMSITGAGFEIFNDYSVRDLTMALAPIPQAADLARTINADLEDLSLDQFHDKYQISISCTDMESPILVGLRPGTGPLTVVCIPHLGQRQDDDSAGLLTLTGVYVVGWGVESREYPRDTSWTMTLTQ